VNLPLKAGYGYPGSVVAIFRSKKWVGHCKGNVYDVPLEHRKGKLISNHLFP